ncbi:MAG: ABC transporter permease subunit [Rhizobiaceae bacterium]|nr:ABC transporter permease subunit [Rhizobiaceae bacterium]
MTAAAIDTDNRNADPAMRRVHVRDHLRTASRIAVLLGGGALALIYLPLLWLAVMSFARNPLSGIPMPLTTMHYQAILNDVRWVKPLLTSIALSAIVALVCMIAATLVARAAIRMRKPGVMLLVSLAPLFIPGLTMGAALFISLRMLMNLTLGLWSIFLAQFIWAFPFALLMVLIVASRFDTRLLHAAEDLGATPWQRFWDIEVPLLRPGIIGAGIFAFLLSFNELLRSLFVRGQDTTMPIYNWIMAASQQSQVPIIFALTTLVLFVTLPITAASFWYVFVKLDKS